MTEEIIVNGFDVSECYADNKMMKDGLYCFWEGGKCEDNEYCYYKECKRLEQENKELKDRLKPYKHPDVVTLLTNWRTGELDRIHNKIANERDAYRSALEEISGLASPHCTQCSQIINIIKEVLQ